MICFCKILSPEASCSLLLFTSSFLSLMDIGGPSWSPAGWGVIVFLQAVSQGNRTRATIKDSVAQIGLDHWTSSELGEKLGREA